MKEETLLIDGLTVIKSGTAILEDVSCQLSAGQVVGVVGANGAGKSTLLSALAGQTNSAGCVEWCGQRPGTAELGYMPQSCTVTAELSVLEVILLGAHECLGWRVSQSDIARAMEVLADLSLSELASRCITTLSGGQQQLVLLAQRLVRQPRLLVLDEATSALDMSHQISVLGLLRRYVIRHRALAIVAIHDLNIAMQFSDQLALLNQGMLIGLDVPERVLTAANIKHCFGLDVDMVKRPTGRPVIAPTIAIQTCF